MFHNTLNAKSKHIKILSKHLDGKGREGKGRYGMGREGKGRVMKGRRQEGIIVAASVTRHKKGEVFGKKYKKVVTKEI